MKNNENSTTSEIQDKLIADLQNRLEEKTRELKTAQTDLQAEKNRRTVAEDVLKQSQEDYRNVVENSLDSIFIIQDKKIVYGNPALADLTGYANEELIGTLFDGYVHPEDREIVKERHRKRLMGKPVAKEYNVRLVVKNKETVWGHLRATKTFTWRGRPATLTFITDVTEQKATEQALRESEEKYRVFIEKMPNGFSQSQIILDENNQLVDFEFLDVNESFLKSTKLKKEQVIGIPVLNLFPELREIMPDMAKVSERIALQGESFKREMFFKTFNKWFEVNGYSTQLGYFNLVYSDITQKKRAEEASENSKAYLESSLNSALNGVLLVDLNHHFTFVNPSFTDLFEITKSEVVGKTVLELSNRLLPHKEAVWIQEGVLKLMKYGEPVHGIEVEVNRKDGSLIPISFSAAAIRDQKYRILGVVVFLKDITERKRTQDLMIQTEKMMSVGGLAAGMAHEINNPLGGMLQGTQNIIRRLSSDLSANKKDAQESGLDLDRLAEYIKKRKIDEMLTGILTSGRRAARIITNMLQFSRQSESNLCPNNINRLIDEVLELSANDYNLFKNYDFRKIKIIKDYDESVPEVSCTKTEIEQVILNLLRNAVHAMVETAEIRVPQLIIRTGTDGHTVHIEVEDNGPGLDPDVQKRIFEPFFTTKPVGKGTGLGLSVSYMIITNNHKGTMEVISEPDQGARFIVRLPLQRSPSPI